MSALARRDWTSRHLDAIVTLAGDAWRIAASTSDGEHVLLRRGDDDRPRVESVETVRRAYVSENS